MTAATLKQLIREDLFRYAGELGFRAFLRTWRFEAGFRLTVLMRLCRLFHGHPATRYGTYHFFAFLYGRSGIRHGVHIPFLTEIGGGLYLPHALNIVANNRCSIGKNCNLSHGVTIGAANRGEREGTPTIGDQVYIAPGAVVFGAIHLGDHAAVGANCVVTKDVPDNAVVAGVPGKIISHDGSDGYVNQTLSTLPDDADTV